MKSKLKRIKIGIVIEVIDDLYKVSIDEEIIDCSMSSKVKNRYRVLPILGDEIQVEISPFDRTRGRIEPKGFIY
jgi:translation initiation factor IF-1